MADGLRKANGERRQAAKGGVLRRALKWMLGLGLVAGAIGAVALFLVYQRTEIPDPNREFQAETTTVYYADGKREIGTFAVQNRDAVALSDVPEHTQQAVVAAENRTFWTDPGIDLKGIARAAFSNVRNESTQGASTITQQYVKILYLSQERTYTRKAKEAFLALKVERELSKSEILQGYLNTIYFGRGAYGIEAASQAYFGKPSRQLKAGESALLASVLNSPSNFDPALGKANRERLLERYRYVLSGMAEAGDIESDRAAKLSRKLPRTVKPEDTNRLGGQRGFLLSLVEKRLRKHGFSDDEIYGGGLDVVTTFRWKAQRSAVRAVREERPRESAKGVHAAVASVQPGTGALRAMYGGSDYIKSQRNWALTGRQPGSSFKPFTLAAGLEQDFTLYDTFTGDEIEVGGGRTVNNEFDENYGPISLEHATKISSNTAYVDLTQQLDSAGADVVDSAVRAGVPEKAPGLDPVDVATLGVADVTPVDMANSYATFAAQGRRSDWYVIERVSDDNGEVRYRHQDNGTERAYTKNIANSVNYALQQVVEDPEGTGNEAQRLGRPAAGKTGTAALRPETVTSAWFVGYTPQLATAVMYVRGPDGTGNLDGAGGLSTFFGGAYPARTWTTAMEGALRGMPERDFVEPADDELIEEPYTPPPTPTETEPEPSPTPEPEPSPSPSPTPRPTPTSKPPKPSPTPEEPSPSPSDDPTVCLSPPGQCKDEETSSPEPEGE